MVELPKVLPVTSPAASTAASVLLLLHVPPVEAVFSSIVALSHTDNGPVMADGSAFTVTVNVA